MAFFGMLQILVFGWYLGKRKRGISRRTLFATVGLFLFLNLSAGVYLMINGVERPQVDFSRKRQL